MSIFQMLNIIQIFRSAIDLYILVCLVPNIVIKLEIRYFIFDKINLKCIEQKWYKKNRKVGQWHKTLWKNVVFVHCTNVAVKAPLSLLFEKKNLKFIVTNARYDFLDTFSVVESKKKMLMQYLTEL